MIFKHCVRWLGQYFDGIIEKFFSKANLEKYEPGLWFSMLKNMLSKTKDYFIDVIRINAYSKKLALVLIIRSFILPLHILDFRKFVIKLDSYFLRISLENTKIIKNNLQFFLKDVESFIILRNNTEKWIYEHLTPKKGEVFVDVGAHIGKYTIEMAKLVGPAGRVFAFEADPDNFNLLKRNVKINNLNNVSTYNIVAWNSESKILFHKGDSSGHGSVKGSQKFGYYTLESKPLDHILYGTKVNWIKIDVEGAEYEVLEGLSQTLETCRPKLIVEIFEKNQEKVFNLMSKFGYKWKEISKQNFLFYT
ncbi:MAG: FkbM family methyltransferase [Candidatus Methanosuratincola petrocarbonis]